jgi:hypothetical protein
MMILPLALSLAAQAASSPASHSTHGGQQQMTCPIGGERFEALVTNHYSTHGGRPDGRPNSYWYIPLPIPECPSNRLVLFDDFTPAQITILTPLIASDEYRRLAHDSTYYRAQWLATRIGQSERQALWLLLSATWQVKPLSGPTGQAMVSPEKARQYQEEFIARVRALPAAPEDREYVALYARAANAERELGRFDSVEAMLRQVDGWVEDGDRGGWQQYVTSLSTVVARRDSSVEPLDMAGEGRASSLCLDPALPVSDFNRAYCARPEVQAAIERTRRFREEAQRQYDAQGNRRN